MKTNRLSKQIEKILNAQVTKEAQAAQIYLAYGSWADSKSYAGISNLLFRHAQEERNHMMKVMDYIMSRGGEAVIDALSAPTANPDSVLQCFEKIFEHEVDNTKAIYKIVSMAQKEGDWATWNFGQWFVKEQIEEETFVMEILDKLIVAGGSEATNEALLLFDTEIGERNDEAELARSSTALNP